MATSATQRTLKWLKNRGLWTGVVERFVGQGKFGVRIDLFGIIDIIALSKAGVVGVQSCSTDFSAHYKKMTVECREQSLQWMRTPGTVLMLIGWRQLVAYKKDGSKAKRGKWTPRIHIFSMKDFASDCKINNPTSK